ncbi:MAG TPA: substrate-binding domain-containing protein, partial [Puia sp.]|nr:substrate-binding domain-containing protein [Puia sp.]
MRFVKTLRGKFLFSLLLNVSVLLLCGCNNGPTKTIGETPTSGTINISVDESFKPIIDSQIKVFESSFPDAHINVHYKAEAECFRDLASDTTRMIIVTRGLNRKENEFYQDSIHYLPLWGLLAFDAIAVIVNNQAKDSIFKMSDIRSILNGSSKEPWQVVMDGVSATSTVRYLIDSVLR